MLVVVSINQEDLSPMSSVKARTTHLSSLVKARKTKFSSRSTIPVNEMCPAHLNSKCEKNTTLLIIYPVIQGGFLQTLVVLSAVGHWLLCTGIDFSSKSFGWISPSGSICVSMTPLARRDPWFVVQQHQCSVAYIGTCRLKQKHRVIPTPGSLIQIYKIRNW